MPGKRIINCHTHIFTGDCVPPFLARTIVLAPFYRLLPLTLFVKIFRWWYSSDRSPYNWPRKRWYKKIARFLYIIRMAAIRYAIFRILKFLAAIVIITVLYYYLYPWLTKQVNQDIIKTSFFDNAYKWLDKNGADNVFLAIVLVILLLLFFQNGRNLIFFILKQTSRFFRMLPGKATMGLIKRYITIVRFARYKNQSGILGRMMSQYPGDTAFVILPMDMEFMGAGKPPKKYEQQMAELLEIKNDHKEEVFPFIFIDPRRKTVGDKKFFDYRIENGKVVLEEGCFIQEYIETHKFSGFKIYPALGYFPFDEVLLPLWKYAQQNCIPLMTHCIRGVIYYRGRKEKAWDEHPIFQQAMGRGDYKPLLLPQMKAVDVQEIFTHPLNYVCLLKKEWLAKVVEKAKDPRIKTLFGYNEQTKEITTGLEDLKICFGHFGGEDEWARFFEKDRDNFASQLVRQPNFGLDFSTHNSQGVPVPGRMEQYWKSADWYTIICSLMLQQDHVYADISYILHGDQAIAPLLRQTLQHKKLKTRVLYGTDFYVVRNHKSDKNMLADIRGCLSREDFEQISEENPITYLSSDCTVTDKVVVTV